MYELVERLGWIVVLLYILSAIRYVLRMKPFLKSESAKSIRKTLTKFHKPLGLLTLAVAFIHGGMAATKVSSSYTGSLALLVMLMTVVGGVLLSMKKISMKNMKVHRLAGIIIVFFVLLHIVAPYLMMY